MTCDAYGSYVDVNKGYNSKRNKHIQSLGFIIPLITNFENIEATLYTGDKYNGEINIRKFYDNNKKPLINTEEKKSFGGDTTYDIDLMYFDLMPIMPGSWTTFVIWSLKPFDLYFRNCQVTEGQTDVSQSFKPIPSFLWSKLYMTADQENDCSNCNIWLDGL